ncbi:hypothetical protein DdX_21883 [Ditylenchus destructor]|uniref:Uncharacterized protein n=1 Tax=Ditylenchus destructor TaxID=166010 RepID=A0AAD4QR67_9BILA|nr:hypothetical protein DdX_21883 [Ditylenchus destructor]
MNSHSRPVVHPYDEVSTRFNSLIEQEFATSPLLLLDGLRRTDPTFENRGDIKWDLMESETISIKPFL